MGLYLPACNRSEQSELGCINDSQACIMPQMELISYAIFRALPLTIHFLQGHGSAKSTVIMSAWKPIEGPSSVAFLEPRPTETNKVLEAAIKGEPHGPWRVGHVQEEYIPLILNVL